MVPADEIDGSGYKYPRWAFGVSSIVFGSIYWIQFYIDDVQITMHWLYMGGVPLNPAATIAI